MKSTIKIYGLALCFGAMSGVAWAQADRSFITHQSGDWSNGTTWEEFFPNFGWIYPASQIPNSGNGGIRIGTGHTVTIRNFDVTADQLTVDGRLNVNFGRTLTITDGPGVDLVTSLNNASVWIDGTLINNGQIQINQGELKIGTIENNGDIEIGGIFQFNQGTITGNDLRYGLTGSAVISFPGYTVDQNNQLWPSTNGPANVTVNGNVTLNGTRTVTGTLNVAGTFHVADTLTTNGTTKVTGTLDVVGTLINNGTIQALTGGIEVSGTLTNNGTTQLNWFTIKPGGAVSGNDFVYIDSRSSTLLFNSSYNINESTVFWPRQNGPADVTVPSSVSVTVNAARAVSDSLQVYGTLQVADTLTTNGTRATGTLQVDGTLITKGTTLVSGTLLIAGTLTNYGTMENFGTYQVSGTLTNNGTTRSIGTYQVSGTLINNGTQSFHTCQVSGMLTNKGATHINFTFQLDQGGTANGSDFTYAGNGTLVFNNSSGAYDVSSGSVYWPNTNGPANVTLQGAGGITMNVARTVTGLFQIAAAVTNGHYLTLSGTVQINAGGFFGSSPIYSGDAKLIYNTGGSYNVGAEWGSGTNVDSGVPLDVEINDGTTVNMPSSPRTCPGDLSIYGILALSTTAGADLSVGGNWNNFGMFIPNSRTVIFNGASEQTIRSVTTFDYLNVDNPAGISVPGYDDGEGGQETDSVRVSQTLAFTAGNLRLGQVWQSFLILSGSVSGSSTDRHVVTDKYGRVVRSIAGGGSFQFPVGPTETSYNPLTIALDPADSTETFSVRVDSTVIPGSPADSLLVQRTWDVQEATPGDNHAALTFQWSGAEEGAKFTRNTSSTYLDNVELVQNGVVSGTDPYNVSTAGGFPCTEFSLYTVGTSGGLTSVEEFENEIPTSFILSQNYPNPFNPSTTIRYNIPKSGYVTLKIYNLLGKEIETLVSEKQPVGEHTVRWNPVGLPSGVYFYRLQAAEFTATRKLILLQ